jgi:acyl CoA:acetate/3-ketoacid CoA transferase
LNVRTAGGISAVLMDIRMPVMDGYEAARAIRASGRPDADVPIIALSADVYTEDIKKAQECGMTAHLSKPLDPELLLKTLREHIPLTREQMDAGTLEVEFVPQGTLAERIHCGGAGLGGCLTPTGIGTKVEEGKQKLTIDGREYLLEKPLHADVAIVKAWKADKYGNLTYRLNGMANNMQIAMAADFVIAEVEELVDVGELTPDEIDTPAVLVDMVYVRTGEKRPLPPSWKRMREGGKK